MPLSSRIAASARLLAAGLSLVTGAAVAQTVGDASNPAGDPLSPSLGRPSQPEQATVIDNSQPASARVEQDDRIARSRDRTEPLTDLQDEPAPAPRSVRIGERTVRLGDRPSP